MVSGNMGFFVYGKKEFLVKGVLDYGLRLCKNNRKMGCFRGNSKWSKVGESFL